MTDFTPDRASRPRVLIGEDDPVAASYLRRAFEKQGYSVEVVPDGASVLARAREGGYAALILNSFLPDLTGLEILQRLNQPTLPFPVIMLAEYGSEEIAVDALQLGAMDYVSKGLDVLWAEKVVRRVERARRRFAEYLEQQERLALMQRQMAELGCLFALEKLFDSVEGSPAVALKTAANVLCPAAMPGRPEACVVVEIGGQVYASDNVFESPVHEQFEIRERGRPVGKLQIRFREPSSDMSPPSLTETERELMLAASDRIGHFMDFWHTEQKLRESNAALEEYAYVASHDLQAPLKKIESFVNLLVEDCSAQLDDVGRRYLEVIRRSVEHMRRLIKDVLALARLNSEGPVIVSVDLNKLLGVVQDQLAAVLVARHAELIVHQMPTVWGDETRLAQLFQNLISNALKFNDKPVPRVEIGAQEEDSCWCIWVRDNGIGMKREDVAKIFLPFKRLHSSDRFEGTGIGLALCLKIVRQHGGSIHVESEPGQGTTFYIRWPKQARAVGELAGGECTTRGGEYEPSSACDRGDVADSARGG